MNPRPRSATDGGTPVADAVAATAGGALRAGAGRQGLRRAVRAAGRSGRLPGPDARRHWQAGTGRQAVEVDHPGLLVRSRGRDHRAVLGGQRAGAGPRARRLPVCAYAGRAATTWSSSRPTTAPRDRASPGCGSCAPATSLSRGDVGGQRGGRIRVSARGWRRTGWPAPGWWCRSWCRCARRVVGGRPARDDQALGDFPVGQTAGQQLEHLHLTAGQVGRTGGPAGGRVAGRGQQPPRPPRSPSGPRGSRRAAGRQASPAERAGRCGRGSVRDR